MCLEGCSPVEVLEVKLAVMLFTFSTLNMSCGTNQLWKGTVLFLGLGQYAISYRITSFPGFGAEINDEHKCAFHASQYLLIYL